MVKAWLQKKGIEYTEVNVDDDPSAAQEIIERTGLMMVPMTLIGDRAVSGMNFGLLASTLGLT
jgi:glutaredoxin